MRAASSAETQRNWIRILLLLHFGLLAGCATTQPVDYQALSVASELQENSGANGAHVRFLFAARTRDWGYYDRFMLDPVEIYRGADQQFGKIQETQKKDLAAYMQVKFSEALALRYAPATAAGSGVLRVHLVLAGVETSIPVIATATKVLPIGFVVNSVQTARDKQACFTGSVSYAVEIYDAASNRLLGAYIAKQYPAAVNVFASFGTLDAAKAGIRKGAGNLLLGFSGSDRND